MYKEAPFSPPKRGLISELKSFGKINPRKEISYFLL